MPTPLAEGQRKFICSANDFSLASGQGGGQIKNNISIQKLLTLLEPPGIWFEILFFW